ncbi:MAG: penicillin-binding protein activator LpoB [Kiritimatiellales bacterium]|nr:penicillin-binding protein activator LpoB [Kiritimatiellales bacterium]MCF7864552.1 penicillin-binding protein activator LpoB [Kiritimatiellales bacterium]
MKKSQLLMSLALVSIVALTGCKTKVKRVGVDETIDLSGRWNDTDSQLVSAEMVSDLASRSWIEEYTAAHGGQKPVVIVGTVRNLSSEHIETETFTKDLERELINSGRVKFVANPIERGELRQERKEQQTWSREETQKRLAAETGADYMLQGGIKTIIDQEGKESVKFYQVDLELVQLESNEKAWIGSKKIKKYVKKRSFSL